MTETVSAFASLRLCVSLPSASLVHGPNAYAKRKEATHEPSLRSADAHIRAHVDPFRRADVGIRAPVLRCAGALHAVSKRLSIALLLVGAIASHAADTHDPFLELNKLAFFHGREYFVLRSGRAQMIVQADQADLGPAFTYLLFDVQDSRQSARKEWAFNFDKDWGFTSSALVVELGNFPFTPLGHRTDTRWVMEDGLPAVEAVWWAGGVRVTERVAALGERGVFLRSVQLQGAHLAGEETVQLRLSLPPGSFESDGAALLSKGKDCRLALVSLSDVPAEPLAEKGELTVGPIRVAPGQSARMDTLLLVQIPADNKQNWQWISALRADGAARERVLTRERWAKSSVLITKDRTVQEVYDKARFALPGMIADDGTMDAGIFEYGAQWVRDTSNTALGALHAGHFEIVRRALVRVLTKMISQEGATMIAGSFDSPDREQFDQMGELLHLLRAYRDWTGDDSLVREHRALLLAMIERPLQPQFRDATGMVHNRREFWERAFDDAYELAYQTYVILGLREAAELAPALGAEDRAARWRTEADRILETMLSHPTRALVREGRLIKRRNLSGEVADDPSGLKGFLPDVPMSTESHHRLLPDASMALPIAFRIVDPRSEVARRTLDHLEELWNTRWSDGGYDRYHTSSQPDQPGPWPFATTFILRAQHEAGMLERSRRSLEWLNTHPGGRAGAFFEEIPSNRAQAKSCGIVCWTSGEIALFVVRHFLGLNFENGQLVIRPALYPDGPPVSADLRFRRGRLRLEIDGAGTVVNAVVDGTTVTPDRTGALRLPGDFAGGTITLHAAKSTINR